MGMIQDMLEQFREGGLETSFQVGRRRYHCFAYQSPARGGPLIRWNLYAVDEGGGARLRGLTFGVARGVQEAVTDLVRAAEHHAKTGAIGGPRGSALTFRPSPQD